MRSYRTALLGCPAGQGNLQELDKRDFLQHLDNLDHSAVPPLTLESRIFFFWIFFWSTESDRRGKCYFCFHPLSLCVMHRDVTFFFFFFPLSLLFLSFSFFSSKGLSESKRWNVLAPKLQILKFALLGDIDPHRAPCSACRGAYNSSNSFHSAPSH